MDGLHNIKLITLFIFGVVGSGISYLLGGWDIPLKALCFFMVTDYITGLIVAGIFRKSKKTKTGGLSSKVGWKGIAKKAGILFVVIMGTILDLLTGQNCARNAAILFYIGNEGISILENLGYMGVKLPSFIRRALDAFVEKGEEGNT